MKKYIVAFIVLIILSVAHMFSQEKGNGTIGPTSGLNVADIPALSVDTLLKVVYSADDKMKERLPIAYFLNGQHISSMTFLKADKMDSLKVAKDTLLIDSKMYYGKIDIATKEGYNIDLISLNQLKVEYTNIGDQKALFFVDGNFIIDSYGEYLVNKHDLLRIFVEKNPNPDIATYLIRILTQTKENIDKLRNPVIYIRGNEE